MERVVDHAADAEGYAEKAERMGLAQAYPPFYRKMVQIMRLAGDDAAVQKWQRRSLENRPN